MTCILYELFFNGIFIYIKEVTAQDKEHRHVKRPEEITEQSFEWLCTFGYNDMVTYYDRQHTYSTSNVNKP